jgi:ABC-type glutathione transport system ATPase component
MGCSSSLFVRPASSIRRALGRCPRAPSLRRCCSSPEPRSRTISDPDAARRRSQAERRGPWRGSPPPHPCLPGYTAHQPLCIRTRFSLAKRTDAQCVCPRHACAHEGTHGHARRVLHTTPPCAVCLCWQVDLTLTPGSKTAVIGRSGSGKTTLMKLLARLYQVPRPLALRE